jgi:hypothetical protein
MKRVRCFLMLIGLLSYAGFAGFFDNLQQHTWYDIPSSHMSVVDPCPGKGCTYSGSGGQAAVMDAWSGGAFDSKRDRLIIWGGGHSDYAGNELYTFDLATQTWRRETNPTTDVSGVSAMSEYPPTTGYVLQPRSRHTYEYVEYIASIDKFCSFGFTSPYPDGGQGGSSMHCYNFTLAKWERGVVPQGWGLGATSAYDPLTGHGWIKGTDSHSFLSEFIPDSGTSGKWFKRTTDSADFFYKYSLTMDIDPAARKLVAVGGGEVWYWDITNPPAGVSQTLTTTTGATSLVGATDPGLAYDPVTGKILGWNGGQTVYSLDVPSKTWTSVSAAGANPGSPNGRGTYGRFRYSPAHNVFVVVNTTGSDVFVYKHTPGASEVEARAIHADGALLQVLPNPFASSAQLRFKIDGTQRVTLRIYDIRGQMVSELLNNRIVRNGFEIGWSPDSRACGTFVARLNAGNKTLTRKLFYIR